MICNLTEIFRLKWSFVDEQDFWRHAKTPEGHFSDTIVLIYELERPSFCKTHSKGKKSSQQFCFQRPRILDLSERSGTNSANRSTNLCRNSCDLQILDKNSRGRAMVFSRNLKRPALGRYLPKRALYRTDFRCNVLNHLQSLGMCLYAKLNNDLLWNY